MNVDLISAQNNSQKVSAKKRSRISCEVAVARVRKALPRSITITQTEFYRFSRKTKPNVHLGVQKTRRPSQSSIDAISDRVMALAERSADGAAADVTLVKLQLLIEEALKRPASARRTKVRPPSSEQA